MFFKIITLDLSTSVKIVTVIMFVKKLLIDDSAKDSGPEEV